MISALSAASSSPIPVSVGFNWTSALMALANVLIGGVIVALIKSRPQLKKIDNEREANLLVERAAEMAEMRARLARLEAERSVDRHKLNNVTQCLEALILLIEMDPNKAKEAASRIKAMRAEQMKAEALEKAAVHAAEIKRTQEDSATAAL